jgi:cytochrome oxidase Cu insertion factor (SCO1/SenC/PrrC family)
VAALVVAASAGIVVHAVTGRAGADPAGSSAADSLLAANPDLDPGTTLSGSAPGFTLTDQFGQPVSLRSYRGKVVILAFNDSECTTICPLTTAAMAGAKAMLGAAGSGVQLLGIDANPKATSIEDVRSYSELHGMMYQWRFLTGSLQELQRTWKAYSIGVTISAGQVDHESAVFVIGPDGQLAKLFLIQQAYSSIGQMGQLLAGEAARLLPGHPPVQSRLSYAQVASISPATTIALPRAEGGSVSLGPGVPARPRLYLFFATWDQEVTSLAGQLDAVNAYQLSAGAAGLPGLTAVDEGSVEPSPSDLTHFLASLPKPLWYPVAIDRSGQVADGYGVQGQPWFVLAGPGGRVLWSWQVSVSGWLSHAALDQHVRAALAKSRTP